jgi:hypothetical protein
MENLSLTKNLVLTPSGSFELDGVPVSKADAVEHYLAVEPLAGWPLAVEVSLLQDRLDTLEAEAGPLDEVLAEAAERAAAARQAHREWYEKESGEIAEAKRQLTAREENLRRNVTPSQGYDATAMSASTRRAAIGAEVTQLSGELEELLAGDRLSTAEVAQIVSSMQAERRRVGAK